MPDRPDDDQHDASRTPTGKLLRALEAAVDGLTYPSDSDEPFSAFIWPDATGESVPALLAARVGKGCRIEQRSPDAFFDELAQSDDAARFAALRRTLASLLRDLHVFRVSTGSPEIGIYLIGHPMADVPGLAGLQTLSVET